MMEGKEKANQRYQPCLQLEKVSPRVGKEVVEQRWQNVLEGAAGHGQGPWQGWLSGVGLEELGTGALSLGAWAL